MLVFIHGSTSFQDYELQLASYSAGLETLLNIPIKKTMLQSPATVVREEVMNQPVQQGAVYSVIKISGPVYIKRLSRISLAV